MIPIFKPKLIWGLLGALFVSLALVSCEEDIPLDLSVTPKEVTIPADGGSATISFTSPVAWKAVSSADWVNISPASGEAGDMVIKLSAKANPDQTERSATVTVSIVDTDYSETVKVIQPGSEPPFVPSLEVQPESLRASAQGEELSFTVTANLAWTASVDADWVSLSAKSGKEGSASVKVSVAENKAESERGAVITVTGEGVSKTVTLSQAAFVPSISLAKNSVSFGATGGRQTIALTANSDWRASVSDSWIHADPVSGSGNATITVDVPENTVLEARSGSIVFTSGSKSVTLAVSQSTATMTEISGIRATVGNWEDGGEITFTSGGQSMPKDQDWMVYLPAEQKAIAMTKGQDGLYTAEVKDHYPTMLMYFVKDNADMFGSVYYSAYIPEEDGTYTTPLALTTSSYYAAYVPVDGPVSVTLDPVALTATFEAIPVLWEYVGKAMFTDGIITYSWELEMRPMEVDLYRNPVNGDYLIPNPYAEMWETYPEEFGYDPENAELIFCIKEDGTVYFKETYTGVTFGEYGPVWVMSLVPECGWNNFAYYGTWDESTLTVVYDVPVAIHLLVDQGYYYSNKDGVMKITLPK